MGGNPFTCRQSGCPPLAPSRQNEKCDSYQPIKMQACERCTPVRYTPVRMHAREMHAYEIHTTIRCTPIRCTPVRYTPIRHPPIRCTLVRCIPVRCTLMRCTPVRYTPMKHTHQMHAHEIYAHRSVAFSLGMKCQRALFVPRALRTLGLFRAVAVSQMSLWPTARAGWVWWKGCRKQLPKALFSAAFSQIQRLIR